MRISLFEKSTNLMGIILATFDRIPTLSRFIKYNSYLSSFRTADK